ncbi:MAG TPA: putative manganese transporter [Candidatus Coprenecus pullistercoris]|nr:putative manganese transporter [Candidatus Coprenecus pullistercoris]
MIWHAVKDVLLNAYLITSLVVVMMIMIEYVNVASAGRWFGRLQGSPLRQVLAGSLLGLIPGCIGGFAAVSLYSHGIISMGALVAAMISSSGDESFVMLAMIPGQAMALFAVLFVLAVVCGLITDRIFRKHPIRVVCDPGFEIHDANKGEFPKIFRLSSYRGMRHAGWERLVLIAAILIFTAAVFSGVLEHEHAAEETAASWLPFNFLSERWMNIIFAVLSLFVAILVAASSEHFVREHLWHHVVRKHALRTFLWTAGALAVIALGMRYVDMGSWLRDNTYYLLILAALVGMIPESGPHMVFISLFAGGYVPFSVLLTSSMSQDGHTSLPLLASSTRSFFVAKVLNAVFAIVIGSVFYLVGL